MARGRMLNKKVAVSGKVARFGDSHGAWGVVFHHRLIAFLDKNGNCRADGYWLKGEVMPRVREVGPDECESFVDGLVSQGLAVRYEIEGMHYLHMPGFRAEQVGLRHDKEKRDVPVPHGFDEASGSWPEVFRKVSVQRTDSFRLVSG